MGKSWQCKLGCGCEIWTGNDYNGNPYILIEHCPIHKIVKVEELKEKPPQPRTMKNRGLNKKGGKNV